MKVQRVLKQVNRRKLTSNTQKVALTLLSANGSWVSRRVLERAARSSAASTAARARDLRKAKFGQFQVDCESATVLKRRGEKSDYFYRINPKKVTEKQIKTIFRL